MHSKSKIVAGLLALFLGSLGIHKFYLGYALEGIIMLLVTLLTGGLLAALVQVVAVVEGIIYLTRSDTAFDAIYVQGRKGWL